MKAEVDRQLEVFQRGVVDLIDPCELAERIGASLASKRPLRVKFGMDPTSPDLHVGHCVPLFKLRDLQQLGHQIVLIVGDATAMVGDPSGRNKLRPPLSRADIDRNLKTYVDQVAQVLDVSKTEIRRNSEWFDPMRFEDVLRLASRMTVARMIERDTFQKRMVDQEPIGIHEFLYPLMQGWDSVMIHCDLELGGTDQLFNLLRGRDLQAEEGQRGQICFTTPLINGPDGRKMSKSYGNAIALTESASEMFRKVMDIDDAVMGAWFEHLTRIPPAEVQALLAGDHRVAKLRLASEVAGAFHAQDRVRAAAEDYERRARGEAPADLRTFAWPADKDEIPLMNVLALAGLVASSSEGRRSIEGKAVKIDGTTQTDPRAVLRRPEADFVLQVGKNKFVRVRVS